MGPAGAVVENKILHPITELGEGGGARGAGQAGADDDDLVFALVGRVDELDLRLVLAPFFGERTGGNPGFKFGHGG